MPVTLYLFEPMNRRCKNVAARTNNIASGENPDFSVRER